MQGFLVDPFTFGLALDREAKEKPKPVLDEVPPLLEATKTGNPNLEYVVRLNVKLEWSLHGSVLKQVNVASL